MSAKTDSITESQRQGISSLEIGLNILNTLTRHAKPLPLKELSSILGLSSSRLHKYMVSLLRMGYISQEEGQGYVLSKSCLMLGVAALSRIDPIQSAFSAAHQLNAELDKTLSVTIWNGKAPLVIQWLDASQPIAVNIRLGMELSPFYSVSGRIFLANLPEKRLKAMLDEFYLNPPALPRYRGQHLERDAFEQHLMQIRHDNLCCFYSDFLPDINVVGSPVIDYNGHISSVISLIGLHGDTDVQPGSFYSEKIRRSAQSVTEAICGRRLQPAVG